MLTGNRVTRIIFCTFFLLVVFLNLYYFLVIESVVEFQPNAYYTIDNGAQRFHGFGWFFNKLSAFPGLDRTFNFITEYGKMLQTFDYTDMMNDILLMLRCIAFPFQLLGTLVVNVFENLFWVLSFFIDYIPKETY